MTNKLGFGLSNTYTSNHDRREDRKLEKARQRVAHMFDVIILLCYAALCVAVIFLVAAGTLPLLGGIAVLIALFIMAHCVYNSFSNN